MFRLFFTPPWFNGWDLLVDAIALVIALCIAAYAWRIYKVERGNKFAYFSGAFLLVALGLLFKIGTSAILYFSPFQQAAAAVVGSVGARTLQFSDLYYRIGFFLYMVPSLGAWLLIFFTSQKSRERLKRWHELSQILLFIYLVILISVIASFSSVVFHLTSAVLLTLIVLNYYRNYLNANKNRRTFQVMCSFFAILIGNLFLVFVTYLPALYAVGELFILVGFLMLLGVYMQVVRH